MLPVLFELPTPWGTPLAIYSYGLMLGLSLVAGYQIVVRLSSRRSTPGDSLPVLPEKLVENAYIVTVVCGLLGARLLYVAFNQELLEDSGARWFDITAGGVTAYGGLFGGALGAAAYLRIKRASLLDFADAGAPAIALGTIITRIGCYLYGCDFGTRLSDDAPALLRALGTFPAGSPAHYHHHDRYGLMDDVAQSFPVHPTQLYEALFGVALLVLALRVYRDRRFSGQAILLTLGAYGTFRFLVEYVRDDPERAYALGFSGAQLISLALVPACAVAYSTLRTRARRAA